MAKRKRGFGNYAVRAVGHKDKAKWKVEVFKTAMQARSAAKRMALQKLGTYAPTVCIFDLSRWGKRPVCIRRDDSVNRYRIKKKIHVVRYQPR